MSVDTFINERLNNEITYSFYFKDHYETYTLELIDKKFSLSCYSLNDFTDLKHVHLKNYLLSSEAVYPYETSFDLSFFRDQSKMLFAGYITEEDFDFKSGIMECVEKKTSLIDHSIMYTEKSKYKLKNFDYFIWYIYFGSHFIIDESKNFMN
jgi:hypothetical protein